MTIHVTNSDYRARLRHWHDLVRRGADLLITDNGEPVVRVSSAAGDAVLDRLERDGVLRQARPRRAAAQLEPVRAPGNSTLAVSQGRHR
jgi:antitoxin (DNA-binding transcriptional repressor) of toxin-antitoxin stability system